MHFLRDKLLPALGLTIIAATIAGCNENVADAGFGTTDRSFTLVNVNLEPQDLTAAGDREVLAFDDFIDSVSTHRVVVVGERHDQNHHHQNQLAVIRALHERHGDIAIGMEFFQRPFQDVLDRYVAGEIDERQMLRDSEYYLRWRYDYRLYAPILRYAREHGIPLVALNLPPEITATVGMSGVEGLTDEQRAQLPAEIDREVPGYEARLRTIFEAHPVAGHGRSFESFVEVQLLWDEGMAETAADYLERNPDRRMVILAGTGHVGYGTGIPLRLERRTGERTGIVVHDDGIGLSADVADYLLLSQPDDLPGAGLMGVMIEPRDDGVYVEAFAEDSGAQEAGIEAGDRIDRINGSPINDTVDVKLAMWDQSAGSRVSVQVARNGGATESFEVELR